MRVVFDTNVFVSPFVFPGSRADAAVRRVLDEVDELVISRAIIDEPLTVLARKFPRDVDELGRSAIFLTDLGEVVRPRSRIAILSNEADNRILECARSGRADLIVTEKSHEGATFTSAIRCDTGVCGYTIGTDRLEPSAQ